jgi:flagellar biosynthesis chaperone FliJ
MRKLEEVKEAKALMTEAMAWSVMKWLREKKRVRKAADKANAALDDLDREVKAGWSSELTSAYKELSDVETAKTERRSQAAPKRSEEISAEVQLFVRRVKEADDQAYQARMDAERTFDEAERSLSTSMAREGCRKAIHSWDLHEKAIRRAEG